MELVYPLIKPLQVMALRAFADWRVTGREGVPPAGPLIIVANHQSNLDPPLLLASVPRRTWFLAKEEIFRGGPATDWFLRQYGAYPVKRGQSDVRAYRWALDKLDHGQAIVIFPEGTRNRGGMKKAQPGIVRLALKSQATLLPVGITGTERLGTWLRVFNPTGRIRVNIGRAFSVPSIDGKSHGEVLDSLTEMIMYKIAALLPETHRGVYGFERRERGAPTSTFGIT